ncbi:MAG: Hpt domain-containing protein [Burkholderiales bacterium]|nr:Hpt domain-containing protein [Burkholderiales bacterium]
MSEKLIIAVDAQIAALVPRFLDNRAADVDKIRAALARGDFEAVRVAAHGMKGAGGAYGFPEISRLGAEMEESVRRRDAAAITSLAARLEAYLARIEIKSDDGQRAPHSG